MTENHGREERINQIRKEWEYRETEDLLAVWIENNRDEWSAETFIAIQRILKDRLVELPLQNLYPPFQNHVDPPQKVEQAVDWFGQAQEWLDQGELERARTDCEEAIRVAPNSADAYNLLGIIYEQLQQPGEAMTAYRRAVHLDPAFEDARQNLQGLMAQLDLSKEIPEVGAHMQQAKAFVEAGELELALSECDAAIQAAPEYVPTYNYRGQILQELERLDEAITSYLEAVRLDPFFYAARENLANARIEKQEAQNRENPFFATIELPEAVAETPAENAPAEAETVLTGPDQEEVGSRSFKEEGQEDGEITYKTEGEPAWLVGWPGHRTRLGRSGLDPLENDFEWAHMQGVLLRQLFTGRLRTRNPVYLFLMFFIGLFFLFPALGCGSIFMFSPPNFAVSAADPFLAFLARLIVLLIVAVFGVIGLALKINTIINLIAMGAANDHNPGESGEALE